MLLSGAESSWTATRSRRLETAVDSFLLLLGAVAVYSASNHVMRSEPRPSEVPMSMFAFAMLLFLMSSVRATQALNRLRGARPLWMILGGVALAIPLLSGILVWSYMAWIATHMD